MWKSYFSSQPTLQKPPSLIQTLGTPLSLTESSALLGLRQLTKLVHRLAKFVLIDSNHQDSVQHIPKQNPARSQETTSLNMRNSTRRTVFTDPEMLGRGQGQLHSPAFYRIVLLSYRILSSALSIWIKITLSLSFLLSINYSLLFL